MTRRRPLGVAALVLFVLLIRPGGARSASISGQVFTAESPDSVARGVPVVLVFHGAAGGATLKRVESRTDDVGHFHFQDLAADTAVAYMLQITYRGKDFLSNPIRFQVDGADIDYNILLSDQPPDQNASAPPPAIGRLPRQNPLHVVLIVLWIVFIYVLFAHLARPKGATDPERDLPPAGRALAREIASLDIRHADGIIGDEEYRKVRDALIARLRSLASPAKGRTA